MKFKIDTENKVLILQEAITTEQLAALVKNHKLQGYTIESENKYTFPLPSGVRTPNILCGDTSHNSWGGNTVVGGIGSCITDNMYYSDKEGSDTRVLLKG